MSISSALQTGVSGLRANSKAVGSISENIANSNTVGYRRGFAHMVTTTASGGNGDGVLSVNAVEEIDISTAGGLISTNSPTDLAIGGILPCRLSLSAGWRHRIRRPHIV